MQKNIIGFGDFSHSDFEDFMIFMSRLVDFKSRFTALHSSSVAACAEIIAKYAGFSESETKVIKYAGLFMI